MSGMLVCHDCDLLQQLPPVPEGQVVFCGRCGAELFQSTRNSLDRTLALNLAGLVLYTVAVSFPFLAMNAQGIVQQTALITGMKVLYQQGMGALALVVILTCILFPLLQMLGLLYILLPLRFGRRLPGAVPVFRWVGYLKPWAMMEVFMIGILVSMVKLAKMASIVPGTALWAFIVLVFILAGSAASLDVHKVWEKLDPRSTKKLPLPVRRANLVSCHICHLLSPAQGQVHCPRCGARLHQRKVNSLGRCWALLITSFVLYLPANLLPITVASKLGTIQTDTIASGILYLLHSGSWYIALVIFIASLFVPLMKMLILLFLMVSVQRCSSWRPRDRTRLYRLTELVGRWSMVDVYVVTIMVALVKLGVLANVDAGPATPYFAGVVILTMFAAQSFDPRLIWDQMEGSDE